MQDRSNVCSANPGAGNHLKLAMSITIVLHALHVARLIHTIVTKFVKKRNIIGGVVKCLLMDCYCTCAAFIYVYVQLAYFANWRKCALPQPKPTQIDHRQYLELTTQWLWWEVIY